MFYKLTDVPQKEIIPGYNARILHSQQMTFVYWDVKNTATLPEHSHPHEQVCHVLEGEFKLVIAGKNYNMKAGEMAVIPSNSPHSGVALSDCRLLDVFWPIREDYRL